MACSAGATWQPGQAIPPATAAGPSQHTQDPLSPASLGDAGQAAATAGAATQIKVATRPRQASTIIARIVIFRCKSVSMVFVSAESL